METKLQAVRRDETGKGVARRLRADGRVPAVLYGHDLDTVALSVDAREMFHILHGAAGANALVDLVVDGTEHLALAREIQRDHIHNKLVHIDFLAVSRTETITVNVPVVEIGEAVGVKEGGVVEHHLREIAVECFPQDVPDQIEVDITELALGDMVHVRDLVAPEGITILTNVEDAVLSIITPAVLRVEADLSVPGEEGVEVPVAEEEEEGAEAPAAEEGAPAAEEGAEAPAAEEGGEG
jgi:large subunit ribosomal protein L25